MRLFRMEPVGPSEKLDHALTPDLLSVLYPHPPPRSSLSPCRLPIHGGGAHLTKSGRSPRDPSRRPTEGRECRRPAEEAGGGAAGQRRPAEGPWQRRPATGGATAYRGRSRWMNFQLFLFQFVCFSLFDA